MTTPISHVHWHVLRISAKTVWSFVEVIDQSGRHGFGEATLGRRESLMEEALDGLRALVLGRPPALVDLAPQRRSGLSLPQYAALSALDQAVCDLAARQQHTTVADWLGGRHHARLALYANLNRGIRERTPSGFAEQARAAVADGFSAVKVAPFDEMELRGDTTLAVPRDLLDKGLARIAAVRAAVGPNVEMMVDCHWRLNEAAASTVLRELQPVGLYWLECPLPEQPELFGALRRLRSQANSFGIRLAGCEEASLVGGFLPFLQAGVYDVMMPDVKYVGGLREMLAVANTLRQHGVTFSPHNPNGPICHAATLQICAAVPSVERLELQYAETPLFDALVAGGLPQPVGGEVELPAGPGFGVSLEPALVSELARRFTAGE